MSREFGSYISGYFHQQIEQGAKDCLAGRDDITKLWGEFLEAFYPIAYAIASSEESDSGPDYPIIETMHQLPELKRKLDAIAEFIEPFSRVAEEAVRNRSRFESDGHF